MNLRLLVETVSHLRLTQIVYQVWYKMYHPRFKECVSPIDSVGVSLLPCIDKYHSQDGDSLTFLNIKDEFSGWNTTVHGMLWAYNLNYMEWLCQKDMVQAEGERWIDRFMENLPSHHIGLDAAPTALRCTNWMKFFMKYPASATKVRLDALYGQIQLLSRKLEFHLLANHLLEDAFCLFFASVFFADERLYRKASLLLERQLREQILPDGAHYEQSPMYHCIMLDRLLDCYNISKNNQRFSGQEAFNDVMKRVAEQMLGHLESIVYADGSIPLLNDSAQGIAPVPSDLFAYAQRLGINYHPVALRECGYRKMETEGVEAVVDIGNITATYQPGHTHADTFSYELRIDGQPIVVDTGISTYDKTPRRQYERGTLAHNTVSVDGCDSSRVWGGFRVGHRAKVSVLNDEPCCVKASHDGFGHNRVHTRRVALDDSGFHVEDTVSGVGKWVSYIHLAPSVKVVLSEQEPGQILLGKHKFIVLGSTRIDIEKNTVATEYNRLENIDVLAIHFDKQLSYTIIR